MEDLRTYYDVLEIPETASATEASAAYKRMVKEYHPDRLVDLPEHLTRLRKDAEEKWQEIQNAWDVLGDPVRRTQYDEALRQLRADAVPDSAPPPSSATGPSAPHPSSHYTPPPPPQPPSWSAPPPPSPSGTHGAGQPSSFGSAPVPKTGLSQGWAIALGWMVFGLVLFFGEAIRVQNLARQRPQPPGWLAGSTFYSLLGAAIFVGVMITGMLQGRRKRAVVASILGTASASVFFILLSAASVGPVQQSTKTVYGQQTTPAPNPVVAHMPDSNRLQIVDCAHLSLRLYNIDDRLEASLSNTVTGSQVLLDVPERQDTGFVDISSHTRPGVNTLSLQLTNYQKGYTYGYQLRNNSTIIDQDVCGEVGVRGCNNNDGTLGVVFRHAFSFQCPGYQPGASSIADAGNSSGDTGGAERNKPALPELSQLQVRAVDPHICEKPNDVYFGNWGPARPAPAGSGQLRNPEFLFDTRHEDKETTINWANGFTGTVPVCFTIDDQGNPDNIRFPQSPGAEIEDHVRTKISGWRYRPGTITQNYLDTPHPISVELAMDFIFSR